MTEFQDNGSSAAEPPEVEQAAREILAESLVGPPAPRAVGTTPVTSDRVMGWAEFGHPDGDLVLWFHGTPGARTQVPPTVDEVALARGFRVIAVERPGTGRSTNHALPPHRGLRGRHRGAGRPTRARPVRRRRAVRRRPVHAGRGARPARPGRGGHPARRARTGPGRRGRVLVHADAAVTWRRRWRCCAPPSGNADGPIVPGGGARRGPGVRPVRPALLGFADRPVLGDPQFKAMFLHDLLTAGDLRATAHDLALFARHWGFQLDEVRCR